MRLLSFILAVSLTLALPAAAQHFANGIKIGEVTENSALIWVRLTSVAEMVTTGKDPAKDKDSAPKHPPERGSVPGMAGKVRIAVSVDPDSEDDWSDWQEVDPKRGHTHQFHATDLTPGTQYAVRVESAAGGAKTEGSFTTAPAADTEAEITFCVVTGQDYPRRDDGDKGHKIYPHMRALDPDFFVHTGDIEYFDKSGPLAKNLEVARYKFTRLYALPNQREFHNHVPSIFIKDDHDTLDNDCWPGRSYGDLTWEQGLALFREQFPVAIDNATPTYRTQRWGKHLQVWFVEGRDFRSANNAPDGPDKTIWGAEQKKWFFDSFAKSDATFRVLVSPTPIVGPDRANKKDNHANRSFTHEGDQIRHFLGEQDNAYVICGDRHWQYHSAHPETGVEEFSCGPTSNKHASGFSEDDRSDWHRYLNIVGGFLSATVHQEAGTPTLSIRHHSTAGEVLNEARLPAK